MELQALLEFSNLSTRNTVGPKDLWKQMTERNLHHCHVAEQKLGVPVIDILQGNQNSRKTNANSWNKGQLEFMIEDLIKIEKSEEVNILKEANEIDELASVSGSDP